MNSGEPRDQAGRGFEQIGPIRPGEETDVVNLWRECGLIVPHNDPYRDIERKMRVNPEWFLVSRLSGRIVGSCMVGYEGHRGWINYLAVSPDRRRTGLATRLMEEAARLLRVVGCPKINLQVRSGNQEVVSFYQKLGYTVDPVTSLGLRLEPDAPSDD